MSHALSHAITSFELSTNSRPSTLHSHSSSLFSSRTYHCLRLYSEHGFAVSLLSDLTNEGRPRTAKRVSGRTDSPAGYLCTHFRGRQTAHVCVRARVRACSCVLYDAFSMSASALNKGGNAISRRKAIAARPYLPCPLPLAVREVKCCQQCLFYGFDAFSILV